MTTQCVVSIVPLLGPERGHDFNFMSVINAELERRGVRHVILANKKYSPKVPTALPCIPHFTYERGDVSNDPICAELENVLMKNRLFYKEMCSMPKELYSESALFFFPGIFYTELVGLYDWIMWLGKLNTPRCLLFYMSPAGMSRENGNIAVRRGGPYYRLGFRLLDRTGAPIRHLAHTPELAEGFTLAARRRIDSAPLHFPCVPSGRVANTQARGSRRVLLYVGDLRWTKGFQFVPEIARLVLARYPDVEAVVHMNAASANAGGAEDINEAGRVFMRAARDLRAMAASNARLRLVEGFLEQPRYCGLIEDSDLVVLAYDKRVYRVNPSGPLTDAMSLGKPVVVAEGTHAAQQVARYGSAGVMFSDYSVAGICAAIGTALDNLGELSVRAQQAMTAFHADHGTSKLVDAILAPA